MILYVYSIDIFGEQFSLVFHWWRKLCASVWSRRLPNQLSAFYSNLFILAVLANKYFEIMVSPLDCFRCGNFSKFNVWLFHADFYFTKIWLGLFISVRFFGVSVLKLVNLLSLWLVVLFSIYAIEIKCPKRWPVVAPRQHRNKQNIRPVLCSKMKREKNARRKCLRMGK